MALDYFKSTGFRIKELVLIGKNGVQQDLTSFYSELNIFDSVLQPCLTGNILIQDSAGLSDLFLFDGNDFLKLHIGKVDEDILDIKRVFRIYKQSDRTVTNQNTESYILHFISEEYITSQIKKVTQYYSGTYTEMAKKVLRDYMKCPEVKITDGQFDDSYGVRGHNFPGYFNPIECIMSLTKLAIDKEQRPCFLFYENIFGYNFASLTYLLKNPPVCNINFDPKNLNISNESRQFTGARYFKVIQQFDILTNIKNGVYSGKYLAMDKATSSFMQINQDYNSINHPESLNNGPAVGNLRTIEGDLLNSYTEASITEGTTNLISSSVQKIREASPGEFENKINYEQILLQRKSILTNLFSQRVKLVVPGNFAISSGVNVYLHVPKYSEKVDGENNLDRTLYGHYLIIAARHKLTPDNKHETIFEACTNGSNRSEKSNKMIGMSNYLSQDIQNYG